MIIRAKIITVESYWTHLDGYQPRVQTHRILNTLRPELAKTFWDALISEILRIEDSQLQNILFKE